jgi:pimeloyl-ACP methyl ester carboxylesterase
VNLLGPLTDPRAHGGDPADAFHVVAPSLPGDGFSTPVRDTGWALARTTRAWAELMGRLGDERCGAQGGDIGAGVAGMLANLDPDHVVGVHINTDPPAVAAAAISPPWKRRICSSATSGKSSAGSGDGGPGAQVSRTAAASQLAKISRPATSSMRIDRPAARRACTVDGQAAAWLPSRRRSAP